MLLRRGARLPARAASTVVKPDVAATDLNWSLCMHEVAPANSAFRNMDRIGLVQRCTGTLSASKALQMNGSETVAVRNLVVMDPKASGETVEMVSEAVSTEKTDARFGTMPPVRYGKVFDKVTDALRHSDEVFVHDWTSAGIPLRLITDDAATALFMRNLTGAAAPAAEPIEHAASASVIFHASALDVPATGIKLAAKEFSVFNPCYNNVVMAGTTNKPAVAAAAETLVASVIQQGHAGLAAADETAAPLEPVVLHCDTLAGPGGLTAVFGGAGLVPAAAVAGAHASLFLDPAAPVPVHSLYPGVSSTHSASVGAAQAGDLLETVATPGGGKLTRATLCRAAAPAAPAPLESVILVVDDASKTLPLLSKLTGEQAAHFFYGGPTADGSVPCFSPIPTNAAKLTERFAAITKDCSVYLVNPSCGSPKLCGDVIQALASGSAKPKFSKNKATGLSVCAALPGTVDNAALKHNVTAAAAKKLGADRLEALLAFHGVVPDVVVKGALA